ncbi:MAG: hypothetical protein JXA98_05535 [Methanosarcinaceae archaeon]|nr:hypothetical protein [Methanosarcinaceae archaeon]
MIHSERERLHQLIDESPLKKKTSDELHSIVNEFLSTDYQRISPQRKKELEFEFRDRRLHFVPHLSRIDSEKAIIILDDLQRTFYTMLDKSVDLSKSKKSFFEKIVGAFSGDLHLFSMKVTLALSFFSMKVPLLHSFFVHVIRIILCTFSTIKASLISPEFSVLKSKEKSDLLQDTNSNEIEGNIE